MKYRRIGEVGHCQSPGTWNKREPFPVQNVNFYERKNFESNKGKEVEDVPLLPIVSSTSFPLFDSSCQDCVKTNIHTYMYAYILYMYTHTHTHTHCESAAFTNCAI